MTGPRAARGVAALVLGVAAIGALVLGRLGDSPDSVAEHRASNEAADELGTWSGGSTAPRPAATVQSPPGVRVASDVERAATAAIAAWQQQNPDTRQDALERLATPAYQSAAADINPTRVPIAPLLSTALRVEADGQALVDAQLEDGTSLIVLLVQVDDTWLLEDLRPGDDLAAVGAG